MVAAALWCAAAFAALLALAYFVGPARWLDNAALHGFTAMSNERVDGIASAVAHLCNPLPYALASP
jgi:hypothetical protein